MPTTNPVPSTDPTDLLFNAGKLDEVVNGTANSFTDRFGVSRRTVAGMNADFDAQLADAESDLNIYRADAAASAAQALGYLNTIRTTSYGAYASDPATDPLGNPPNVGDEYFNTTSNLLKRFNGTTWQASDINTANLAAPSGSSLVGYDTGTVQDVLDAVTGPNGAASVGFTPAGTGAVATTVQQQLRNIQEWAVNVKDAPFYAKGDGVTDDVAAIQAALDYVGSTGGGTVKLPKTNGKYRITNGLKIPSYVTLEGVAPDRYPFNGSSTDSCLLADFSNINQWVIEPKTTKNGVAVAHNDIIKTTDTFSYTFNCGVKNLHIDAVNTIPFGAVRMHGCPGSMVESVSAVGTGAGLLVNQCYGGSYVMHSLTKYYGTIAWEDVNACSFDVYNAGIEPLTLTVPSEYLMPFMSAFNGILVGTYKLNSNSHYNRSWGMILGGNTSISANNRVKLVAERYSGGAFQHQAYGTEFDGFYVESAASVMEFACVATVSRFVINSLHAYMSGTGKVFDLGITVNARVTAIGFVDYPQYGFGPYLDNSSLVTIDGVSAQHFGPATPQFNLVYTSGGTHWLAPTLLNSWVNAGAGDSDAGYRLNSRTGNVELRGMISGGALNANAFILPAGFRPISRKRVATYNSSFFILASGEVIPVTGTGGSVWLDGISFAAEL